MGRDPLIRFQVQIAVRDDGETDPLWYQGTRLDEQELGRLIKQLVYEHTNVYAESITVSVLMLPEHVRDLQT